MIQVETKYSFVRDLSVSQTTKHIVEVKLVDICAGFFTHRNYIIKPMLLTPAGKIRLLTDGGIRLT